MESLIKALNIPLAVLFFCGIAISLRHRRKASNISLLLLFVIVLLPLRLFYGIANDVSSRYYSIYIVLAVLLIGCIFRNIEKANYKIQIIFTLIFLTVASINIYITFSSGNNVYLKDIHDYVENCAPQEIFDAFTDSNDSARIGFQTFLDEDIIKKDETNNISLVLSNMIKRYSLWGNTVYLLLKKSEKTEPIRSPGVKQVGVFISNKSKGIKRFLFRIEPYTLSNNEQESISKKQNLIENGIFEQITDRQIFNRRMKKWVESGEDFYLDEDLLEPKHEYLLEYWKLNPSNRYPHVFLDSNNCISGKYSLHVIIQDKARIFLLNKLPSVAGDLQFTIKGLSNNKYITVRRIDYDANNTYVPTDSLYYIKLAYNKTQKYSICYKQDDFCGINSLFYIESDKADFIIDDIAYYHE